MGNYLSCSSCSCVCINATFQRAKLAAASDQSQSQRKKLIEKASIIMVVHSVEERVMEMGGGAPMKVAELMLEFPGHFVVGGCETETSTMDDVKRATPLPADHEASPGRVYILFPMHRLHTRVAPHESATYKALFSSYIIGNSHLHFPNCSSKKSKSLHSLMQSSSAKVTPISSLHLSTEEEQVPVHLTASHQPADAQPDDEIDLLLQHFCSMQSSQMNIASSSMSKSGSLARSRSWIPKLETINESSILVV